MAQYKVFTLGEKFPLNEMRDLVHDLHDNDQHYIVMVDPGNFKHMLYCECANDRSCGISGLSCVQPRQRCRYFLERKQR